MKYIFLLLYDTLLNINGITRYWKRTKRAKRTDSLISRNDSIDIGLSLRWAKCLDIRGLDIITPSLGAISHNEEFSFCLDTVLPNAFLSFCKCSAMDLIHKYVILLSFSPPLKAFAIVSPHRKWFPNISNIKLLNNVWRIFSTIPVIKLGN